MQTSADIAAGPLRRAGLLLAVYTALALAQYAPVVGGRELYPFSSFNLYRRPFRALYQLAYRCERDVAPARLVSGAGGLSAVRPQPLAEPCALLPAQASATCATCGDREVGWLRADFKALATANSSDESVGDFSSATTCPCVE